MKRIAIAALLAVTIAGPAFAASPTPGVFLSTDLGGAVLMGRGSQSWSAPLNANQGLGDVFNSQSWDGALLGTQWIMSCGVSPAAQTIVDNRIAGTGTVVFTTNFIGGTFWLSRTGPWGDGVNDWTGVLNTTQNIVTLQYVNFIPVQARANVNTSGYFTNTTSNCALTFAISNGVGLGDTDGGPFPANYPALLDVGCGATRTFGSWGDIKDIALQIDCVVPTEVSTWSAVKAQYR